MVKEYYYPTIEKTFPLEDLSIPPKKYALFLNQCIDTYISFVLEQNKSKTVEEAEEKYRRKIKELNPGKKDEELHLLNDPMIEAYISGELEFSKPSRKLKENFYRRITDSERLINGEFACYGIPIKLVEYANQIQYYVNNFDKALNKKYPKRNNKVQGGILSFLKSEFPTEFKLNLLLRSFPTYNLETEITLCNYGTLMPANEDKEYFIPGIEIKSGLLRGSLEIPRKMVKTLEDVFNDHYKTDITVGIGNKISYAEDVK